MRSQINNPFKSREANYNKVPQELFFCSHLSHVGFRLMAYLCVWENPHPNYVQIQHATGMSAKTISKALKELVALKMVNYVRGYAVGSNKKNNCYVLNESTEWAVPTIQTPVAPTIQREVAPLSKGKTINAKENTKLNTKAKLRAKKKPLSHTGENHNNVMAGGDVEGQGYEDTHNLIYVEPPFDSDEGKLGEDAEERGHPKPGHAYANSPPAGKRKPLSQSRRCETLTVPVSTNRDPSDDDYIDDTEFTRSVITDHVAAAMRVQRIEYDHWQEERSKRPPRERYVPPRHSISPTHLEEDTSGRNASQAYQAALRERAAKFFKDRKEYAQELRDARYSEDDIKEMVDANYQLAVEHLPFFDSSE